MAPRVEVGPGRRPVLGMLWRNSTVIDFLATLRDNPTHVGLRVMAARSQPTPRAHVPGWVRYFNAVARRLLRAGLPMGPNGLLTVRGRKTGLLRSTPVTIPQ